MCGIWAYLLKQHIGYDKSMTELYSKFINITGRGPDNNSFRNFKDKFILGFQRLAIMDPTNRGDQPFSFYDKKTDTNYFCICNGEIYNAQELEDSLDFKFNGTSDCEVLIPLFIEHGIEDMLNLLKGVFSFIIIRENNDNYDAFIARDRIGVRPSFLGYDSKDGNIGICSEMKGLIGVFKNIIPFTPGYYLTFDNYTKDAFQFHQYYPFEYKYDGISDRTETQMHQTIRVLFEASIRKRLISDKPVCALLSGGLDSSLVCSVASRILAENNKKLYTFSIGMEGSPDIVYAEKVAKFIGSVHTTVNITNDEALKCIKDVVWATETFDITTIRASVGQYLISKYIAENTKYKVVLSGDGSDEVTSGYLYNFNAPSNEELHKEAVRRVKEIHLYDSLRADRATSMHGLELRVPFLDSDWLDYYLGINPEYRKPTKDRMEKYLLRKSFDGYIPDEVLYRQKEAFSDGISSCENSWFTTIQKFVNEKVSENELERCKKLYDHCVPTTKEGLYYREIFTELFGDEYCNVIPDIWMPMWTETDDPSARTIKNIYKTHEIKDSY